MEIKMTDNAVSDWVIVIQLNEYLTENGDLTWDFKQAKVYRQTSRCEVEALLESMEEFGRCIRQVVEYKQAEQDYYIKFAGKKLRKACYEYLTELAKNAPDAKIKLVVHSPFVGLLTATAGEALKALRNESADFVILKINKE